MPNGHSVRLSPVPAIRPEPAPEGAPDTAPISVPAGIEAALGPAVAHAAAGMCYGLFEHQENGALSNETKMENGRRLAEIVMLRLETIGDPGLDFFGVARREGARVLRARIPPDFYDRHGPGAGEATIDMIISSVFEIVEKSVAIELAHQARN